jgi:hypothetical protein
MNWRNITDGDLKTDTIGAIAMGPRHLSRAWCS